MYFVFQSRLYQTEVSEEEAQETYKNSYEEYLKLEKKLLTDLGIPVDDDKEDIPNLI